MGGGGGWGLYRQVVDCASARPDAWDARKTIERLGESRGFHYILQGSQGRPPGTVWSTSAYLVERGLLVDIHWGMAGGRQRASRSLLICS